MSRIKNWEREGRGLFLNCVYVVLLGGNNYPNIQTLERPIGLHCILEIRQLFPPSSSSLLRCLEKKTFFLLTR